jgi:hypothetical protein
MSEDTIQLICIAVATVCQIYMMEPWHFPVLAAIWNWLAQFLGNLANVLGHMSLRARLNYFEAVEAYGA